MVLDPLALQPGLDERRVRVEVLRVEVDAGRVEAVHQSLVEGRPPAAQRVKHRELPV